MAFTAYHNVNGSNGVDVESVAVGDNASNIKSILITNTHATDDGTISLFIVKLSQDSTAQQLFYLLKLVRVNAFTSLLLDNPNMLAFDNTDNGYALYVTVGSTDTFDILIKR